jgi:hypothetical protein
VRDAAPLKRGKVTMPLYAVPTHKKGIAIPTGQGDAVQRKRQVPSNALFKRRYSELRPNP